MQVSTQFDPKEERFRNFGHLMGPFSDFALRHMWGDGPEVKVTIAYVDPANVVAASYEVTIKTDEHILSHKPDFVKPLRPGVWKVKLLYLWELVAEVEFVVLPLTYYDGKNITDNILPRIHRGPEHDLYVGRSFKDMVAALGLEDTKKLQEDAKVNGRRTGKDLRNWIDGLMKKTWSIGESCVVGDIAGVCPRLKQCQWTYWSSKSPDPKSMISSIDPSTGFLVRAPSR